DLVRARPDPRPRLRSRPGHRARLRRGPRWTDLDRGYAGRRRHVLFRAANRRSFKLHVPGSKRSPRNLVRLKLGTWNVEPRARNSDMSAPRVLVVDDEPQI